VLAGMPLADLAQPAFPVALGADRDVPAAVQELASSLIEGPMPAEMTAGKLAPEGPSGQR
jgi:hypothetical protein